MKTLLISEIFPPKVGGSGRWFWEIYSRMPQEDYLVAAGDDSESACFDAAHRVNCVRWPLTFPSWGIASAGGMAGYLKLLRLLRPLVEKLGLSDIHCGRCLPEGLLGWVAWRLTGVPYLCYVHGEELATYQSSREYQFLSELVFSGAKRLIVNSENTRRSLVRYTNKNHGAIRLMHPGVDTGYFTPTGADRLFRDRLGWGGRRVVLTVGRLQKRKGHDHTILALKQVAERIPEVLYAIVGDGEERECLEQITLRENLQKHVQFLGSVADDVLLSCYQQCDLFILANREVNGDFEGFGMVLVEAQACGKPVIAGTSGGTAETMRPGETGLLVDADDPQAIAEVIIRTLEDERRCEEMGRKAVDWVRSALDWQALAVQAEGIFGELRELT